jgi:hypothetical protein
LQWEPGDQTAPPFPAEGIRGLKPTGSTIAVYIKPIFTLNNELLKAKGLKGASLAITAKACRLSLLALNRFPQRLFPVYASVWPFIPASG